MRFSATPFLAVPVHQPNDLPPVPNSLMEPTRPARRLVEEIAAMRYVLRNLFRLASEAEETWEHIRLVEIYDSG